MIQKFVDFYMDKKEELKKQFTDNEPEAYSDIVKGVVSVLSKMDEYDAPDPERITEIDHGSYQGDKLYIICAKGYQPNTYWFVNVSYGSCSGCDTLCSVKGYDDSEENKSKRVSGYMDLALHILQGMKPLNGEEV